MIMQLSCNNRTKGSMFSEKSPAPIDHGKLREIDENPLLQIESKSESEGEVSFSQVQALGELSRQQQFDTVLPSNKPLPAWATSIGQELFFGRVAFGKSPAEQYPVTGKFLQLPDGAWDVELQIVPVSVEVFSSLGESSHQDSMLALAAATVAAPWYINGLETGLRGDCSSQTEATRLLASDHGTPLAAVFGSFQTNGSFADAATQVAGNPHISIRDAAHLHHKPAAVSRALSTAASATKVAAGMQLHTYKRSELPRHALLVATTTTEHGAPQIVTQQEMFSSLVGTDFSLIAVALGVAHSVVGEAVHEKKMEQLLKLESADTPLRELVQS